jgi:hypothetical protein
MSVKHGDKGWIQETSLTWQIMILISQSNKFHFILVPRLVLRSSITGEIIVELLQQGLIVLQVSRSGMEAQERLRQKARKFSWSGLVRTLFDFIMSCA